MREHQGGQGIRTSARARLALVVFMVIQGAVMAGETVFFFSGHWRPYGIMLSFVEAGLLLGFSTLLLISSLRTTWLSAGWT